MRVTVLKNGQTTDYYFDPEHYAKAFDAYKEMQANGEIQAFSIVVGRN